MLNRINAFGIATDHANTLRDPDTRRFSIADVVLHLLIPAGAGICVAVLRMELTSDGVSLLVTALSVFVGLLFNLLVLATGLRIAEPTSYIYASSRQLSREILVNIEFAIAIAFLAIVCLLPATLAAPQTVLSEDNRQLLWRAMSGIATADVFSFVITLLMVLKRMHIVLMQHFDRSTEVTLGRTSSALTDQTEISEAE